MDELKLKWYQRILEIKWCKNGYESQIEFMNQTDIIMDYKNWL